jgi:hypothetical protein
MCVCSRKEPEKMIRGIAILIFFNLYISCYSQAVTGKIKTDSVCLSIISQAGMKFNNGLYLDCLENIEQAVSKYEMKRAEKIRALELAAKASVELGEMGKADTYVNILLKTFPHYDLKEQENSETYNRLVKKYKIHPQFSIGIRNTADWINYKTTKIFSVLDGLDYSKSYNQKLEGILTGFGLMYYGWAEFEFDKDISLNGDLILKWTKFSRDFSKASTFDLNFSETDNYIEIPLYMKKYFHIGKNTLSYMAAGMGWLYMTKANGNATIYYTNTDSTATTGNINMLGMRNRHNFEWIAGVGIGYKLKNLRLFLDVRYYGGMNSFTNPQRGLNNSMLVKDYFYIDNAVKLNQFEIGASVSFTFLNSVKRIRH